MVFMKRAYMNKRVILVILLFITLTINMINLYYSSNKEFQSNLNNYIAFAKKAKEIEYYSHKYSIKIRLKKCNIQNNQIECKNLSKNDLRAISSFLKSNAKLKNFNIKENKTLSFYAEMKK